MRVRLTSLLAGAWLLSAAAGAASERSAVLASRGLEAMHAQHYRDALALFDQALDADAHDVYPRYYRATARAHLGDYDGAVTDLQLVLAARPDLDEAALDLGVALIETKRYGEAVPWLRQAQRAPGVAARAALFLGIADLRLGQLDDARRSFERAAQDPQQHLAAEYYEGVTDYRQGNWTAAERRFSDVAQASPESPIGHEAGAFLVKLGAAQPRRYHLYAGVGFQYDSNVILAPSTDASAAENALGVSGQSDVRTTYSLGGTFVPWRTDRFHLTVGYDFFQSLHKDLDQFDLQDHGPGAEFAAHFGPLRLALLGRYDYYLLDAASFLQQATVLPWAAITTGDVGRCEIYYQMLRRDYKKLAFSVRDDFNHAVGARQYFYLGSPDRYVAVGYQFDHEDPVVSGRLVREGIFSTQAAQSFEYDGNEVNTDVGWLLPGQVSVQASYAYRHDRFAPASAAFIPSHSRREDNEHVLVVAANRPLWKTIGVTAAYLADFNNSNDSRFAYDRHIVSLGLTWNY